MEEDLKSCRWTGAYLPEKKPAMQSLPPMSRWRSRRRSCISAEKTNPGLSGSPGTWCATTSLPSIAPW